jgi:hypothetical protein
MRSISKPAEDPAGLDRPISCSPPLKQQLGEHSRRWLVQSPLPSPAILERLALGLTPPQESEGLEGGGAAI